ncbi:MAG: PBP1A family penicillin-binding protein [Clostridiales bacterium]|nr:PBP1A family penicillin-binding protein [Clostridiales bacterium]
MKKSKRRQIQVQQDPDEMPRQEQDEPVEAEAEGTENADEQVTIRSGGRKARKKAKMEERKAAKSFDSEDASLDETIRDLPQPLEEMHARRKAMPELMREKPQDVFADEIEDETGDEVAGGDQPLESPDHQDEANDSEPQEPEENDEENKPEKSPRKRKRDEEAAYFSRESDLKKRTALRYARSRRKAARVLHTPNINRTGVPRKSHFFRNSFLTVLSLGVIVLIGAFFYFDMANWQSLDVDRITAAAQTGRMYDNAGELITVIKGVENRVVIPLEEIPEDIQNVFLAAEDLRFYKHHGIDFVRLFGAVVANVKEGGFAQGASTITMQLIRQSHLSTQKTIARKLEEVYLAFMLEQSMSKDDILAMYLNYIYFGNGAYGLQTAAQTYFGVDAKDLSLTQAAALASSIKAPSYYSPTASESNNRSRRRYILDTMLEQKMISQDEHDNAAKAELVLVKKPAEDLPYGWFVDAVLVEAESILGVSSDQVLSGGYTIDTTLSRTHQETLEKQFKTDVFPAKASDGTAVQGAAACVNVKTGEVLAVVGGREYTVRRGLNRATQLRRQPGSSLKPLVVFAPAIDRFGYMTASVLKDEPINFNGYKPRNSSYTYYGNVSIRSAITSSLNVSTVSLFNDIGVAAGREYLEKVGIPLDARDASLSLALGSMTYGVSPVQLAAAYSPFANGGKFYSPHFVRKITDPTGRVVYQNRDSGTRVIKETTSFLMTSLLQSVTSSGTGAKLSGAGTPVAGKTGTVNMTGGGNRDIWMAAYNSEISTAFWMGFDESDSKHKMQSWVSGGDNTAAMARNYFKALYQNRSKPQFASAPKGIVALEIDKQAIKWRGEAMLAVDVTPKAYRYTEYFTSDNRPTRKSDVWTPPRSANKFTVGHSDQGYPQLMIQPSDTAIYRVQRDTEGESFILTELYGSAGETLYYTDTSARAGIVYTYRVIPVHAELLNNGVLLEGVQSVQVAQARISGGQSIWDSVLDFFGGGKTAEVEQDVVESMTENQTSIFWNNAP